MAKIEDLIAQIPDERLKIGATRHPSLAIRLPVADCAGWLRGVAQEPIVAEEGRRLGYALKTIGCGSDPCSHYPWLAALSRTEGG